MLRRSELLLQQTQGTGGRSSMDRSSPQHMTPDSISSPILDAGAGDLHTGAHDDLVPLGPHPLHGAERHDLARLLAGLRLALAGPTDDFAVERRLVPLHNVAVILSWRVFWLTMLNRARPNLEPALVLTGLDTKILDRLIPDSTADPPAARTLSLYLIKIARLGGYLDRAKDPPPGNIVMWRGLSRLTDIVLGATLKIDDVGN